MRPQRPLDTVISSLKFPPCGEILCAGRADRGAWIRVWRSVDADIDRFIPLLPRTPHYTAQYRSLVDRHDAGDPELQGLGNLDKLIPAFREILAEVE